MNTIAIIGFGGAGYNAARAIRKTDREALIDVYSDTDKGPYCPMLTTYFVKGSIPLEAMYPFGTIDEIQKELNINFYNKTVTAVNGAEKCIVTDDGTEKAYDNIIITTGSSAIMPPIPGLDLPGVFKMRTDADALYLKELLDSDKARTCLVIGASWVGIKVVEDTVMAGLETTLVDGADWMFITAAFEETSLRAQKYLESKGVRVSCGEMLDHIEQESDGSLTAFMKNGDRFNADCIAICIGVRMNTGCLKDSGIAMNRGVIVDRKMQTNIPGIYAAGDCCESIDSQSGTNMNIGVWANAQQQGAVAGVNAAGGNQAFDANILINLAHFLDYDFLAYGNIRLCSPDDDWYEYEDEKYYIKACRGQDGSIKCVNITGSADINGLFRNNFIKGLIEGETSFNVKAACQMRDKGVPQSFIDFLGGIKID